MTFQYCSDLHLEFPENRKMLARRPIIPTGEILLLAGDIIPFAVLDQGNDFINFASDHFSAVYWIPGNHEYYGSDIGEKANPLFEKIRDNFFLVNNQSIIVGGSKLVFSTLWGQIDPFHELNIQRRISDFSAIRENGRRFLPHSFSFYHRQSLEFLKAALQPEDAVQTIVVTHHVPTLLNYPAIYKNSPLTEVFAVELSDFIEESGADYWIYGHHHVNTPAFTIGKTKMMTNQLGYVRQYEHQSFRRNALLE